MSKPFRPSFRRSRHRSDTARDVDEEIAFHHAMRERELIEAGLSAAEARRVARESFGDEASVRDTVARIDAQIERRRRVKRFFGSVVQDLHFALRGLRRNPLFALVAVSTLALGIGGNVVVFSLVEAVLMRAPAVESPGRLVSVWTTCRAGDPRCSSSYPDFESYRDRSTQFVDVAAYTPATVTADAGGGPDVVGAELVSANYFTLLGLTPAAGRLLQPADDDAAADPAIVVLSHAWWRTRFGADPAIVGSTLRVNGVPYTVVGVAPDEFQGLVLGQVPELWPLLRGVPLLMSDGAARLEQRGTRWIQNLVGRLSPGATVESARAELLRISDQLAAEDPDARGPRSVTVEALAGRVGGDDTAMTSFLAVLQGVVALTLILACANLANLLLARATARRAETGVRLALGVGRGRLIRQHLTEIVLLALAGAAAAGLLAALVLSVVDGVTLPRGIDIGATGASLNLQVFLFLGAVTVIAALLAGVAPSVMASGSSVASALRGQRFGGSRSAPRLRSALIGVQIALSVVMLIGATLFLRTLRNRLDVDLGFDADNVALLVVDPRLGGVAPDAVAGLADRLTERLRGLPGVLSAAAGRTVPISPGGNGTFVEVDGYQPAPDEEMRVEYSVVSPDYLRMLRLPVVAGRDFVAADATGEPVVIIDETMADAWWPGRDPVGGTIHVGQSSFRVIGVARRTAWGGLDVGNTPFVFVPADPNAAFAPMFTLLVRTDRDPMALLPSLRAAIRELEPQLAIRRTGTMEAEIDALLAPQRTAAWLLGAFGLLALALAAIGIWGVVSYAVAQRRRDFGIRIALGATPAQLVRMVSRTALLPIAIGLFAGTLAARSLSGTIRSFMFGLSGTELGTYVVVSLSLAVVALAATWLPARRAGATDPVSAMRAD